MLEEIKNFKIVKKEIRNFGIIFCVILLVISGFLFWKEIESFKILLAIGVIFLITSIVKPIFLKPIYWIWMVFAIITGWVMTRVILSILYYSTFTSIGLISRLLGKKFLELHWDKSRESYWHYRTAKKFKKENYEKQF